VEYPSAKFKRFIFRLKSSHVHAFFITALLLDPGTIGKQQNILVWSDSTMSSLVFTPRLRASNQRRISSLSWIKLTQDKAHTMGGDELNMLNINYNRETDHDLVHPLVEGNPFRRSIAVYARNIRHEIYRARHRAI